MTKCRYCSKKKNDVLTTHTNEVYIEKKNLPYTKIDKYYITASCGWCGCTSLVEINYCPMCGRKLGEE